MEDFERLLREGLSWDNMKKIMGAPQLAKHLLLLGLPMKVVKEVSCGPESWAFKGTAHKGRLADLHGHHLTQQQRPEYAFGNHTSIARTATRVLRRERRIWIASKVRKESKMAPNIIPLPGSTKGKQNTTVRGPRKNYERVESALRNEVKDYTEMDSFFGELCDVKGDSDQKVGSELEVTNSSREEPDDFDIEMAKAEEEGVFGEQAEQTFQIPGLPIFNPGNTEGAGRQTKRKRESTISLDLPTFDLPGDLDQDQKRRALAGQWNSPVGEEGRDRQTKRKRESRISAESPRFDLPGEIDHHQKRRKLKTGTKSSQAPPAGPQDKGSEKANAELGPCDLFCLGTTVGDVFQAMKAVGGLENPQEDSTDVKLIIAGVLYPTEGQHDIRVAKAAANLEIDQGASNVPGLDPADRDALKEVFGEPDKLQPSEDKEKEPSAFVTFPRKVKYHERYSVNKSLLRQHRYTNMFKRVKKPTQPSEKFLSFFATRRQREVLLHKGEDLWDEEDASFIRSGEEIAEPGARLGAEFVAKRLLEGGRSPLTKLVRDSQKSVRQRRKEELRRPDNKTVPRKVKRKLGQIKNSGLSTVVAEGKKAKPRA